MKLRHLCCFICFTLFVVACTPDPLDEESYENWRHSLGRPERSDMKNGGNTVITKERKIEQIDPSVVRVAKTKGDYMEVMARQFRQDLLSTGAQVRQEGTRVYLHIPTATAFGTNQTTIKPSFEPALIAIAQNLQNHPETMIRIVGHTDNSIGVIPSKTLSLRQANALSNYLNKKGVDPDRLLAEGVGSVEPIANNSTAAGRIKNCYIEMIVYNLQ